MQYTPLEWIMRDIVSSIRRRRPRRAQILCAFMSALALNGCQYIADSNRAYRIEHDIPDGSTLIVEQPLPVPPGRRDLYIQFGQVQASGQVDRYYPHCELVLLHSDDKGRVLPAGHYVIHGAAAYIDPNAKARAPEMIAAPTTNRDLGPSAALYATRMTLSGPHASDVKEMVCGELYEERSGAHYPSIHDIREILGELARLEVRGRD